MRPPTGLQAETSITPRDHEVLDLRVGGRLAAAYHHGPDLPRPYLAPLLHPSGRPVTAEPRPPDHPHHRGVWAGHRDVAGVDHWTDFAGHGRIVQRDFAIAGETLTTELEWLDGRGRAALCEHRVLRLHPGPVLDLEIRLTAPKPVTLGANKDASLAAVRVAPSMTRLRNAAGGIGEAACWGQRAAWCDASSGTLALAVLDHPGNPRHPAPWHVRAYGLMASNPFLREPMRFDAGEHVTFRYRLIVHSGDPVDERYREYAAGG